MKKLQKLLEDSYLRETSNLSQNHPEKGETCLSLEKLGFSDKYGSKNK